MKFSLPYKGQVALLAFISFTFSFQLKAQYIPKAPLLISTGTYLGETKALRDLPVVSPNEYNAMVTKANKKLLNPKLKDRSYPYASSAFPKGPDAAWQKEMGAVESKKRKPVMNFEGQTSPFYPPDCNGSVGPSHYFQTVNTTYAIYAKTGTKVAGPTDLNLVFGSVTGSSCNDGDPIILYDDQADRWLFVEFSLCGSNQYMLIAVSSSPDPTGTYHAYSFDVADTPDYEKMGVWRDGYYMATNTDPGSDVYVFEREAMIAGAASPKMVAFDNPNRPTSIDGFMCIPPIDNDGAFAPAGSPGMFIAMNDDAIGGGSDQLWIYELSVNWTNPAASSFARTQQINVSPFDSNFGNTWTNIKQPGTTQKLDAIPQVIMNVPQYRNFGTYQSIVCCHTVDVDGTDHAGIRWYELRKTTGAWSVRQQGTYAPDAHSRWMGSIMLNTTGKIGLGYSISSSTEYPGIRYCGQSSNAYASATNTLDVAEEIIHSGSFSQTNAERWGDYSLLSVDPTDNETFWFTTEYVGSGDSHKSKIASFKILASPTVITQAATSVTATTAALNGSVNPNGLATDYYFKWGTTSLYGNVTATVPAGSGSVNLAVNANLTGLTPGTTYHFALVATNGDGTENGSDLTFIPGQAEVSTSAITNITATTATGGGNVTTDGGSTVTRGVCWNTAASPTITNAHTTDGTGQGSYTSAITGLIPGTVYHVRAYATNAAGTTYGNDVTFTSGALTAPLATSASAISSGGFTSNWNAVDGAASYNLDVSLYQSFSITGGSSTLTEGFNTGTTAPAGWTFTAIAGTYATTGNYGAASPSIKMDLTGDAVTTAAVSSAATQLSFWYKGQTTDASSALKVEGFDGTSWITIDNLNPLSNKAITITYNSGSSPALPADMVKFRFTYSKSGGNLAFDDLSIISGGTLPSFAAGYENLSVNAISQSVSGLTASTPYFYRVRSKNGANSSGNSNVIAVTTATGGTTPVLTVSPSVLSGFTYSEGNGPSTSQSYNLGGYNLTNAPGTITLTGSANYEVSTDNITFSGSADVAFSSATLASTPIYIRLKAGLFIGTYNSEFIANAGDGAPTMNVTCSGSITSLLSPAITAGTLTAFVNQTVNTLSAEKSYTVSGLNLTGNIIITPPAGFEISTTSGSGFVANPGTITLAQSGGVVASTVVYVRFAPISVQAYSGSISHTSTGAIAQEVAVSGAGIAASTDPQVVISQVYGGGGNTGALFTNDFIELFNRGTSSVNLNGWSVQYGSATGATWSTTSLIDFTLAPGQYFLVQEAKGTGGTLALPTPDVTGTLTLSGTNGKVALVSDAIALSGTNPTGSSIIDFVGYGSATCFEGTAATSVLSNTTAAIRNSDGCTDNNENSTDFVTGTPAPRNTSATLNLCVPATPVLTVAPASLSGFTYMEGSGPSVSQTYELSGSNLTGAPGTITITGTAHYEVSDNNSTFGPSVTIPYATSTLTAIPVYVILKSGLTEGAYNSESITNAGGGAPTANVTGSGSVTPFTGTTFYDRSVVDVYSFQKTIYVDLKDIAKGDILVYNVQGKLIRSLPALQGLSRIDPDVPGIYIVKVQTAKISLVKKVWIK